MLNAGVDLYELSPTRIQRNRRLGFLGSSRVVHAKTAVIDRSLVFIGSMNLDSRSATKNTELGMIVDSPELAKEVLRVIHISKLQSAYGCVCAPTAKPRMADDGRRKEIVLTSEPDSTFFLRLQNILLAPFFRRINCRGVGQYGDNALNDVALVVKSDTGLAPLGSAQATESLLVDCAVFLPETSRRLPGHQLDRFAVRCCARGSVPFVRASL